MIRRVHQTFLSSLDALTRSPDGMKNAGQLDTDALLNLLIQEACRAHGVDPEQYVEALAVDETMQEELQERVAELSSLPEFAGSVRAKRLREAERQLHLYRYLLSGEEPASWVWEGLDPEERVRARMSRRSGVDEDDAVKLDDIRRALARAGTDAFGRCEGCGDEILLERLQLVPWAARCVPCQRALEGAPRENPPATIPVLRF